MHTHAQILVVSRDPMLLQTRKLILGTYFEVASAGRMSEAESVLAQCDFDLIVLCDTLSPDECRGMEAMAHLHQPEPTLLSLLGPGNRYTPSCSGRTLECSAGPMRLLKECANILHCDLQSKNKPLPLGFSAPPRASVGLMRGGA